jgi:hypothetical protein
MSTNIRHRGGGRGIKQTVVAASPDRASEAHESKRSKGIASIHQSCYSVAAVSTVADSVTLWMPSDDKNIFALGSVLV